MKKDLEIINKIDASGLITVDVSDFNSKAPRKTIDLSDWLEDGLIIREASFKKRSNFNDRANCF